VDEYEEVGILLVEDNPLDAELMMRGLKDQKLANSITWVKDGGQASDRFGLSP
jgi:two-component system response regulator